MSEPILVGWEPGAALLSGIVRHRVACEPKFAVEALPRRDGSVIMRLTRSDGRSVSLATTSSMSPEFLAEFLNG